MPVLMLKVQEVYFYTIKPGRKGQHVIWFAKPDSIIYTNTGMCKQADYRLKAAGSNH